MHKTTKVFAKEAIVDVSAIGPISGFALASERFHPNKSLHQRQTATKMAGTKRKRGEKRSIHPRNRYADNPPDFSLLASLYPSFSKFVFNSKDGHPRINWADFNATRELTRVLLHHDHSLNWWIPDGQLCPTVPNRSNYIHWIDDLLASDIIEKNNVDGGKVRGFDIGTGANCIYPLLGATLLGWSFVGSDITDVALEWAEKNAKSNPHISDLIEIRRVHITDPTNSSDIVESSGCKIEDSSIGLLEDVENLTNPEMKELDDYVASSEVEANLNETKFHEAEHLSVDKGYQGPPILLGVVKEGEKFDFCMCNPPFFESMREAGLNPKTSCGGTPDEMVCQGGERAFICHIIEDSVALKQSIRWYTSMVGKKSNLKFLIAKLREVGVTIVKTTEFVQGQTCRWGLAWSFMPAAKRLVSSHVVEKSNLSFMLEGLHRQTGAFNVLQSSESFFNHFGASCKSNPSSFTVDVSVSNDCCDVISKTDVKELDEATSLPNVAESSNCALTFSFRISVFQQIPGTLLVRGSLQQKDRHLSGAFTSVLQQLEKYLKHKYCRQKTSIISHHNPR